jgi:glucose-1-phosphate thymidylyltransferase
MQIIVFEDQHVANLAPITLTRPAFAISCGAYLLIDLLMLLADRYGAVLRVVVRPHLRAITAEDYPFLVQNKITGAAPLLLINSRLVPRASAVNELERLFRTGKDGVVRSGDSIAAARVAADTFGESSLTAEHIAATIDRAGLPTLAADLPLFEHPHDIVRHHKQIIGENLAHRVACGNYTQTHDGVFLAASGDDAALPAIADTAVLDTTQGPVVIGSRAVVGPHTSIAGPCYIGPAAKIAPGTSIKGWVALGHTTKVGGEIEGVILEPYTNKQHEGVLGYSYLGSWINIGAGTNQSDLKNTYGSIRVDYGQGKIDTRMQFFGSVMGDYAKTAINTGIFTGKIIGAASMLYGTITRNVPSFVNYAQSFGQLGEIPVEVAVAMQRRMFARRGVAQRACDEQLLRDVFDLTAPNRAGLNLSTDPLQF